MTYCCQSPEWRISYELFTAKKTRKKERPKCCMILWILNNALPNDPVDWLLNLPHAHTLTSAHFDPEIRIYSLNLQSFQANMHILSIAWVELETSIFNLILYWCDYMNSLTECPADDNMNKLETKAHKIIRAHLNGLYQFKQKYKKKHKQNRM